MFTVTSPLLNWGNNTEKGKEAYETLTQVSCDEFVLTLEMNLQKPTTPLHKDGRPSFIIYICEKNSAEAISIGHADTIHTIKQMPRVGVSLWDLYTFQSLRVNSWEGKKNCKRKKNKNLSGKLKERMWFLLLHGYIALHILRNPHICVRKLIKLFAKHMRLWLYWTCFWIKKSFQTICMCCTVYAPYSSFEWNK